MVRARGEGVPPGHPSLHCLLPDRRQVACGVALRGFFTHPSSSDWRPLPLCHHPQDGTLTVSNIDYVAMRERTGIPRGDLFTVMESWDDGDQIRSSMDVILELEAQARMTLEAMPSVREVLSHLQRCGVRVGLVTRNTPAAVDAFFALIGEEYRRVFDIVLTREFKHVKPDKRCLTHFAQVRGEGRGEGRRRGGGGRGRGLLEGRGGTAVGDGG